MKQEKEKSIGGNTEVLVFEVYVCRRLRADLTKYVCTVTNGVPFWGVLHVVFYYTLMSPTSVFWGA